MGDGREEGWILNEMQLSSEMREAWWAVCVFQVLGEFFFKHWLHSQFSFPQLC